MLGDNNPNATKVTTGLENQLNDVSKMADNVIEKFNQLNSTIGNSDSIDNFARTVQTTMSNVKLYVDDVKQSMDSLQSGNNDNLLNNFSNIESRIRSMHDAITQVSQSMSDEVKSSLGSSVSEIESNINQLISGIENLGRNVEPAFDSAINGFDRLNQSVSNTSREIDGLTRSVEKDNDALRTIAEHVNPIIGNFGELNKILQTSQENSSKLEQELHKFGNINVSPISKNEMDTLDAVLNRLSGAFDKETKNLNQTPDEILKPFETLINVLGTVSGKLESSVKSLNTSSDLSSLGAINRIDDSLNYLSRMNSIIKDTQEKVNSFIDSQNLDNGDEIKQRFNDSIDSRLDFFRQIDQQIDQFRNVSRTNFGQSLNNVLTPGNNDYQLINMTLGNTYSGALHHNVDSIAGNANNLVRQGRRVEDSQRWDSKTSNSVEKFRSKRAVNIQGANQEAENLQRLAASYQIIEKQLNSEIRKANDSNLPHSERQQAKGLAIQNYRKLADTQSEINDSSIKLEDFINISNKGNYDKLDSETKKWIEQVKHVLKDSFESNQNLLDMGKMLGLDETDADISKLEKYNKSLGEIGNTLEKNTTKSNGLWDNIKSGFSAINGFGGTLSKAAGIFGVGALPLTLAGGLNFVSGVTDAYTRQGDYITQGAMANAAAGLTGSDYSLKDRVQKTGEEYYRKTNGLVDFQDYNNSYINLARNVGGQVGESKSNAAVDLNSINENTFAMSKIYNISDSQLAQSVNTFYKDLRMSANDTITTLQNLASTANASNIPVSQYVQIVTNLAEQYRSIGIGGNASINIMDKLMSSGMTNVNEAQQFASNVGGAVNRFSDNTGSAAFWGISSGQYRDPFSAAWGAENKLDANGNPVQGYGEGIAKSIDKMLSTYSGMAGNNEEFQKHLIYQQLKSQLGFSDAQASVGSNRYFDNKNMFEDFINSNGKLEDGTTPGEDENSIQAQTDKFNKELSDAADHLSGTTKVLATLKDAQWNLATEVTPTLDTAFKALQNTVSTLMKQLEDSIGSLINVINGVLDSKTGSGILNWIGEHPKTAAAGVVAARFAPKIVTTGIDWTKKLIGKFRSSGGAAGGEAGAARTAATAAEESADDLARIASGASSTEGTFSRTLGKFARKVPLLGTAIGVGLDKYSGKSWGQSLWDGAFTGVGGALGTAGGALVPGANLTGVSEFAGGVAGSAIGHKVGDSLYSWIFGDSKTSSNNENQDQLLGMVDSSSSNSYSADEVRDQLAKKNSEKMQPLFEQITKAQSESSDSNAKSTSEAIYTNAKDQINSLDTLTSTNKSHFQNLITSVQDSSLTEAQKLDTLAGILQQISANNTNLGVNADGSGGEIDGTGAEGSANKIWSFFKSKGLSNIQISGIMGNLERESNLESTALNRSSGAFGIAQWLGGRKTGLDSFAAQQGKSNTDLDVQLQYMWKELKGSESASLAALKGAGSVEEATNIFEKKYERAGNSEVAMNERIKYANQFYDKFNGSSNSGSSGGSDNSNNYNIASFSGSLGTPSTKVDSMMNSLNQHMINKDITYSYGAAHANEDWNKFISGAKADCSSLVEQFYKEFLGINLGTGSAQNIYDSSQGNKVNKNNLQIGDVVFFGSGTSDITHTGVYAGSNKYYQMGSNGKPISLESMDGSWSDNGKNIHYVGAKNYGVAGTGVTDNGDNGSGDGSGPNTEVTPIYAMATVTCGVLNVRSGPSTNSPIVGSMKRGEQSSVSGKTNNGWYRLTYDSKNAYVYGQYLSVGEETVLGGASPISSSGSSGSSGSGLVDTSNYNPTDPSTWTKTGSPFARGSLINNLVGASSMSSYFTNDPNAKFNALGAAQDINDKGGTDGDVTINQQSMARNFLINLAKTSNTSSANSEFSKTLESDNSTTYKPSIDSIMDTYSVAASNPNNYALTITLDKNGQSDEQYNNFVQQVMGLVQNMGGEIKDVKQSVSDVQNSLIDTNYTIAANNQIVYNYNRG